MIEQDETQRQVDQFFLEEEVAECQFVWHNYGRQRKQHIVCSPSHICKEC